MNMFKKNGGFTLVELIVVIAILAILAAVAVPAYNGYITKAQEAADTTALAAVKTACQATYATIGEVVEITVTDSETAGADTVTVRLQGMKDTDSDLNPAADTDTAANFKLFFGKDFDIDLATGTTATWAAGANSEWEIN